MAIAPAGASTALARASPAAARRKSAAQKKARIVGPVMAALLERGWRKSSSVKAAGPAAAWGALVGRRFRRGGRDGLGPGSAVDEICYWNIASNMERGRAKYP